MGGCMGGFTEGAYEYVKSAPGLANGFFIPYGQSLTETEATLPCPTAKVSNITGPMQELQGSYAQLSGYEYAVKPCTSGACANQDLKGFAAALEESPLSICVNAGVWNSYTGGVMSSAACGPMGAAYQDHCVMAVGFNTTVQLHTGLFAIVGPPRGATRATFTWKWLKILVGWQTMQPFQPLKWTFLRPRLLRQPFVAKQCISELRGTNSHRWLSDVDIASGYLFWGQC